MHVPCFEILPKKYIIIYFSTNKFRTVMNIPSFVLRPKYINNVISYHVGNNMCVISYHVGNNMCVISYHVGNNMYACNNNRKHYLEKVK